MTYDVDDHEQSDEMHHCTNMQDKMAVKQLCSPPVMDIHIKTTLIITGKHSIACR